MSSKQQKRPISLVIGFTLLLAAFVYDYMQEPNRDILVDDSAPAVEAAEDSVLTPMPSSSGSSMPIILSEGRAQHILYGDHKGGGHKFGVGKPCKSEFPRSWNDQKILDVTRRIAANDNLPWKLQRNGYHVAEAYEGDVRVRVVKGPQKKRIITAYPTNVKRNPCPANDF